MTKKIIYSLMAVLTLVFTLNSCVDDTDYETPQIACEEPVLTGNNVELSNIITFWETNGGGNTVTVFNEDYPDYITVYVTSNDKTGNFYKELFVQDKPADPTAAVKLSIDMRSLYTKYEPGRKLFVYLKGLAIGKNQSGELMIAENNQNGISDYIRENVVKKNIIRNCEAVELTPLMFSSPLEISSDHHGMYVGLDNVQFDIDIIGENFVDPNDSYDTHRNLTSCNDNSTIKLETSTFASFKNKTIPQKSGLVFGILSRDYSDEFNVLRVNDVDAFTFEGERCDPEVLDCGIADSQGTDNLFEDNFETQLVNSLITGNGWTNYIQEGTEGWEAFHSTSGSTSLGVSAHIGSYNSEDDTSIAWLITPAIDFDAQNNETFVFKTSNSFSDGSNLELLFSSDWDGTEDNIESATWGIVPAAYIVQDDDFYVDWFDSGIVDLSCAEGTMYIAFKYTGSGDPDFDGTFELDEISIDFTP